MCAVATAGSDLRAGEEVGPSLHRAVISLPPCWDFPPRVVSRRNPPCRPSRKNQFGCRGGAACQCSGCGRAEPDTREDLFAAAAPSQPPPRSRTLAPRRVGPVPVRAETTAAVGRRFLTRHRNVERLRTNAKVKAAAKTDRIAQKKQVRIQQLQEEEEEEEEEEEVSGNSQLSADIRGQEADRGQWGVRRRQRARTHGCAAARVCWGGAWALGSSSASLHRTLSHDRCPPSGTFSTAVSSMTYSVRRPFTLLLVLAWVSSILMAATPPELCKSLTTFRSRLDAAERRKFMKHNFPLNYTVQVRPQEVFRLHNINKLTTRVPDLELRDLQELWLLVNQEVLKKILLVLPERHPSRHYTSSLQELLRMVQQVFQQLQDVPGDEDELPEQIEEIWAQLRDPNSTGRKQMTPKALVDNCYRTMHCLFSDCFPRSDSNSQQNYCSILHWRKGKKQNTRA
ncbi:interleukin-34-like [Arapaima gigas]